ncbi:MAG: penicillin acylase family protein, partial [Pseudomonadota bacterium]
AALFSDMPRHALAAPANNDPLSPFKPRGLAGASNAWAAAEARSARSGTLLANDPHLGLTAPSIWYLARMELETGGVIGGTIPGLPVVLVGRSDDLGWGLTSSYVDDQDILIERLNPDDPTEYLTPDGFAPFTTRQSIIEIAEEPPVTLELTWTENGPVLPGSHYNLETVTPEGHVAALSWTLLSPNDTSVEAGIDLMRAKSVAEGLAATQSYIAPAQNLTLADRTDIALKVIGALPERHVRHQSRGRMPSPGWVSTNRWLGVFDQSVNPVSINPIGGILGNTNNKPISRAFPEHLSFVWGDTQRIQRWARLMQLRRVHTRDSFIEAQLDPVSTTARTLLPLIGADLWFQTEAAEPGTLAERRKVALNLLANWNGEMNEHLPEPLIYAAWVRALQIRLIQDDLGPLAEEFAHLEPLLIERAFRDVEGASRWCDVIQSAPVETCADMAEVALDDALIWLSETYGGSVTSLRWGDAHEATHDHPVLGKVPVLKWFVNIRQSTSGGDNTLLRGRTIGTGPDPFLNVHAAGYRGVYDFGDPDSSVFVISTGQSGHPLSRYYDDLGELWRRGEYIPMSLDPELARAGGIGITRLIPAPTGETAAPVVRSNQPEP